MFTNQAIYKLKECINRSVNNLSVFIVEIQLFVKKRRCPKSDDVSLSSNSYFEYILKLSTCIRSMYYY